MRDWHRFSGVAGMAIALFILSGRWSLSSLGAEVTLLGTILEIRVWVAALCLGLLLTPTCRQTRLSGFCPEPSAQETTIGICIFLLYAMLTGLWTSNLTECFSKQLDLAFMLLVAVTIHRCLRLGDPALIKLWFWKYVVFLTGILAILALVMIVLRGPQRIAVLGGGPNVFGRLMGLLCLGSLFFAKRQERLWWLIPAAVAAVLTLTTGSRGAVGALAVALSAFLLIERPGKWVIVGLVGTIGGSVFITLQFSDVGRRALELFTNRLIDPATGGFYYSMRDKIFATALELAVEHPVWGAGLGSFDYEGFHRYPHNMLLEVFCECGTVGIGLLFIPVLLVSMTLWTHRRHLDAVTVAALVHIAVASQVSGDLYDSRAIFVFLILSMIYDAPRTTDSQQRQGPFLRDRS